MRNFIGWVVDLAALALFAFGVMMFFRGVWRAGDFVIGLFS